MNFILKVFCFFGLHDWFEADLMLGPQEERTNLPINICINCNTIRAAEDLR